MRVKAGDHEIENSGNGSDQGQGRAARKAKKRKREETAAQGNENDAGSGDEENLITAPKREEAEASLQEEEPKGVETIRGVGSIEGEKGRVKGPIRNGEIVETVRGEEAKGALQADLRRHEKGRIGGQGRRCREDEERRPRFCCRFFHGPLLPASRCQPRGSNDRRANSPNASAGGYPRAR